MNQYMNILGQKARKASLQKVNSKVKNKILKRYVSLLNKDRNSIIIANKKDIKFAQKKKIEE